MLIIMGHAAMASIAAIAMLKLNNKRFSFLGSIPIIHYLSMVLMDVELR